MTGTWVCLDCGRAMSRDEVWIIDPGPICINRAECHDAELHRDDPAGYRPVADVMAGGAEE